MPSRIRARAARFRSAAPRSYVSCTRAEPKKLFSPIAAPVAAQVRRRPPADSSHHYVHFGTEQMYCVNLARGGQIGISHPDQIYTVLMLGICNFLIAAVEKLLY